MKKFTFIEVTDGISKKEFKTIDLMKDAVKRINKAYNEYGYSPLRVHYKLDFLKEPVVVNVHLTFYDQFTDLIPYVLIYHYREDGRHYIAKDKSYVKKISKGTGIKKNKWIVYFTPYMDL